MSAVASVDVIKKLAARVRVGRSGRLIGVDASRGVALFGMIAVHVLPQSTAQGEPTWMFAVCGGRAAAAFAVLAGVGIAFMTGRGRLSRADVAPVAAMLATRAVVLGAIGLALGYTDASSALVILPYYALLFLFAIPLVALSTRAIAVLGAVCAAGCPVLTRVLVPQLPPPSLDNLGFGDVFAHPLPVLSELSITGGYPALTWIPYLCAGLVCGRLTLSRPRTAVGLFCAGTLTAGVAALGSSLLLNQFGGLAHIWAAQPGSGLSAEDTADLLTFEGDGTTPPSSWWWLAVDRPHTGTPFDLLGTIGSSAALLGAMLLIAHLAVPPLRQAARLLQVPLAAAGSMTLTLYTSHVMFIDSDYAPDSEITSYLLQVVAATVFALAWRATIGRGPLEGLVTTLATGMRRQVASRSTNNSEHAN